MKIALTYNKNTISTSDVINISDIPTQEHYSSKSIERVAKALEKGGHTVKLIEANMHAIDEMHDFMPKVMDGDRPGLVFNMAYGLQGQNRYTHVPALLEMLGVPYLGSGPEAHAIVQDKVMTKLVLQRNNIPTPGFWVFSSHEDEFDDIVFPVIVKPKSESTSMGMKVADNWDDLREAVKEEIEKYHQEALVEQFIPGREFAVGLIGNADSVEVLPIVEIDLQGDPNKIQSNADKLEKPLDKICPAKLTEEQAHEMKRLCIMAYKKLGIHDFCRVDFRMDKDGHMYILELNSMASLGATGSFVHAAKTAGYTFESLINKLLDVAVIRYFGESPSQVPQMDASENLRTQPLRVAARSYLRSHLRTTVSFLQEICAINTSVRNVENINRLGTILSKRLTHLGFSEHVHNQFDIGDIRYFANHEGATNDVLLISHLDTPYAARDHVQFREEKSKLFGSGIAESKGGIAVMLSTLQALRFSKKLRKIKCGILLTTDDSLGGQYAQPLIKSYSKNTKYVIGLKWGAIDGGIITSASGRDEFKINILNISDSSLPTISELIPIVCKKIIAIQKISKKGNAIRIMSIEGHTSFGNSPDHATISLYTTFKNKTDANESERQIKSILKKQETMKLDIEISKSARRDPYIESTNTKKMYTLVEEMANRLEIKINSTHRGISSDISHVPPEIPSLEGLGPLGAEYRSPNEYILKDSLIDRSLLLALVINKCAHVEKSSK
ncbi:MAG TPA: M20/M25/M40 family metallo-hydrolase [Nitrosopumilus sp.]|nr:M20/M25/M40 family metallo-hydrolase [Thermoproteota archaeon]HJJ23384.1 M20/M25/M40 family metallo-hydrolase [Nitrosopumilus sp.]